MAKRVNNYSRTTDRVDYVKITDDIDELLNYLEKYGRLKSNRKLSPRMINERCIEYYNNIQILNNRIESFNYNCLQDSTDNIDITLFKKEKSKYQHKLINLCSIVIGNVIKKFPTLYPVYYEDVMHFCILDILTMINRNKYDKNKSAFHSYIYEVSYWAIIKYIDAKAKQENNSVDLLQE